MNFNIIHNNNLIEGNLIYNKEQYFDFFPEINTDISVAIAYLNIQFDSEEMKAKYIWGFSSKDSWINNKLEIPKYFPGELQIATCCEAGRTYRLDKFSDMW